MKVKVIKRAELESLGETQETARKTPKRKRIARVVEKWVAEIRDKAETERPISFENLFTKPESST